MNILHLHPGPDTGGTSMGAKPILEERGHSVRVFVAVQHRHGYPPAEPWNPQAVDESIDWADVVIVHNEPGLWQRVSPMGGGSPW